MTSTHGFTRHRYREVQFLSIRREAGHATVGDLPPAMAKLKAFREMLTEEEISGILNESYSNPSDEIDFEAFLRAYPNLQSRATAKLGGSKNSFAFLKATTCQALGFVVHGVSIPPVGGLASENLNGPHEHRQFLCRGLNRCNVIVDALYVSAANLCCLSFNSALYEEPSFCMGIKISPSCS